MHLEINIEQQILKYLEKVKLQKLKWTSEDGKDEIKYLKYLILQVQVLALSMYNLDQINRRLCKVLF